jgi:hypothetical protein
MSSTTSKTITLYTPDIASGSGDFFRNFYGGFYSSTTEDPSIFISPVPVPNTSIITLESDSNQISASYSNLVPNFINPYRVSSTKDYFESDEQWRSYMVGGTYGETTYDPKIDNTSHELLNLTFEYPYSKLEYNMLNNTSINNTIEVSYDYQHYIDTYQSTINNFSSETYIPNLYILADLANSPVIPTDDIYDSRLIDYASLSGLYEDLYSELFTEDIEKNLLGKYLLPENFDLPLDTDTREWCESKLGTMFFDSNAVRDILRLEHGENEYLPFAAKINFQNMESGDFVKKFISSGFENRMLLFLNNIFVNQSEDLLFSVSDYEMATEYISGSNERYTDASEITTEQLKQVNYIDFLSYARNTYINANPNCMFVGARDFRRLSALDDTGYYRHFNISSAVETLEHAIEFMNDPANFSIDQIYNIENFDYSETVAYRIEKIGGLPGNDSLTQNAIQNFWFINSSPQDLFEFYDNQIKYNTEYTYNVYCYKLVGGMKYEYSDILTTRNIGCDETDKYGLEFYDPEDPYYGSRERLFSGSMYDDTAGGTYGTLAQIYSPYPFLSDFNIKYEPHMKIVEMPIFSKTISAIDHPPMAPNIITNSYVDDSQRINFDMSISSVSFVKSVYPSSISDSDRDVEEKYLTSNDIDNTMDIDKDSVSRIRSLEAYRLDYKPVSVTEFDVGLQQTIDLYDPDTGVMRVFARYTDQISTNQKYYYLFRGLNENFTPGHISEIYEVELINDGGYKFLLVNTLSEADLIPKPEIILSKQIKKIFQLEPALKNLVLNYVNADFSQTAASQIELITVGDEESGFWNKTYKIRLISKKTGKKIDFNITYKIGSE